MSAPPTTADRPLGSPGVAWHFASRAARRARTADSSGLVALAGFLLFLVPDRYAIGPSGLSVGTTTLLGGVALVVWLAAQFALRPDEHHFNPIRVALLVYVASALVGVASAYRRELTSVESSGTVRALVITFGVIGLGLAACDLVRTRDGVGRIVTALLFGSYLSAFVAVGQKLWSFGYIGYWAKVPGLHTVQDQTQSGVLLSGRAVGTAAHPIEFSVACAALFALAVVQSRYASTRSMVLTHRAGAALLAVGCLVGVSRSGVIGLAIAVVLLVPLLAPRQRINAVGAAFVMLLVVQIFSNSTLSTLRYQFLHIGSDNSSRGRSADYGPVFDLVNSHLWTGIGLGTFNPVQYRYLDDAWLGVLVGQGVIGIILLAGVLLTALYVAGSVRHSTTDPYSGAVAHALSIALIVLAICAAFFDEFGFIQTLTVLFLAIGLIGALYRIERSAHAPRYADPVVYD